MKSVKGLDSRFGVQPFVFFTLPSNLPILLPYHPALLQEQSLNLFLRARQDYNKKVLQIFRFTGLCAEREGFEPPVPLGTTVFKTVVIDHSTISPSNP